MSKFSERLRKAMDLKNVQPIELSKRTKIAQSSISEYLADKVQARQDKILLFSEALNVDPAWLMGADVPMERSKSTEEVIDESEELAQLMEELHKNPDLRILMSTSSKVTPDSLRALINLAQNMKEKDE